MKHLILTLLGLLLLSQTIGAQSATRLEVMDVKSYIIDLSVQAYDGEKNLPFLWHIITLEGTPGNGSIMTKAILNFYEEGDERIDFKVHFDEETKTVYAHYAVSEFDKFYELLKHRKNALTASYRDAPSFKLKEFKLKVYGKVPMTW